MEERSFEVIAVPMGTPACITEKSARVPNAGSITNEEGCGTKKGAVKKREIIFSQPSFYA